MTSNNINLDSTIGLLIKLRRKEKLMTQQDLADDIGVTYQQIQKYESGSNRIRASLLAQISDSLEVNIVYFFQDVSKSNIASIECQYTLRMIEIVNSIPLEGDKKSFVKMVSGMYDLVFAEDKS